MKRYELKLLDGPGAGKSIRSDSAPPIIWLCKDASKRWWTFKEPFMSFPVAEYHLLGQAPRVDGSYLVAYGVKEEEQDATARAE